MGLGVLEDHTIENVPGTVFLNEDGVINLDLAAEAGSLGRQQLAAGLKHNNNIVLVPQVKSLTQSSLNITD